MSVINLIYYYVIGFMHISKLTHLAGNFCLRLSSISGGGGRGRRKYTLTES